MQAHSRVGGYAVYGVFVDRVDWDSMDYRHREDWSMSWIRKFQRPDGPPPDAPAATDGEWMQDFPALHEYLTAVRDVDGKSRRTSTLTLFADGGSWKGFLNERALGCSLCATGSTIADVLSALEVMLEGDSPPWRWEERPGRPGGKKGRPGT